MTDWLAGNWPWILAAVAYALGRVSGVPPMWKAIALAVIEAIEAHGDSPAAEAIKRTVKAKIPAGNGEMADALVRAGDEKHRQPMGKRILDVVLKALPLVGRFVK